MKIREPVIVISAPRSGSTLLFSILASHPDLWSLYEESEPILERFFHPRRSNWRRGNELEASDASGEIAGALRLAFYAGAVNQQVIFWNRGSKIYSHSPWEKVLNRVNRNVVSPLLKPSQIRLVEKTPKNSLRVPFLNAVFPDAFFLHLIRDPRANLSSLMEGWQLPGRYATYQVPGGLEIEGYDGSAWNFLLPAGWEAYSKGVRLEQVCAFQYRAANRKALDDLSQIPSSRKMTVRYEDLVSQPERTVRAICDRVGCRYGGGTRRMARTMPVVNSSGQPDDDKWQKNAAAIASILDSVAQVSLEMGYTV